MDTIFGKLRAAFTACATLIFVCHAAAAYPEKPIRVILPYSPGGGGDLILRTIQPLLEKRLGQPIVVEYKPGAGGNIGAGEVARAAPAQRPSTAPTPSRPILFTDPSRRAVPSPPGRQTL